MKHIISTMAILLMILASCSGPSPKPVHQELNSVYYWKTVFHLDDAEIAFLKKHAIGRVYLRMFDVSEDKYVCSINDRAYPNASVKVDDEDYRFITDSLKDKEFVPVVYITLEALKAMNGHEGVLATNIVTRVRNMCEYNGLPNVCELQLDCDWTTSTEKSFFSLCDSVKLSIKKLGLSWRLSSTIRLHQLSRKAPPVDNGVLMVYNTGNFDDPDASNSIIDVKDIKPYLKHLHGYALHLDVAYPTYSWQLLFRKRHFIGLLNGLNTNDTTAFVKEGENVYRAKRDIPYNDRLIRKGDIVRHEKSEYTDIVSVKKMIDKALSGSERSNILYHLDSKNISNYTDNEIEQLLSTAD